jgi:hypothetical protein
MSAMIECAFINSVITTESDRDTSSRTVKTKRITGQTCAQQDTMARKISGLKPMWLRPSAAQEKSEYASTPLK